MANLGPEPGTVVVIVMEEWMGREDSLVHAVGIDLDSCRDCEADADTIDTANLCRLEANLEVHHAVVVDIVAADYSSSAAVGSDDCIDGHLCLRLPSIQERLVELHSWAASFVRPPLEQTSETASAILQRRLFH